MIELSTACSSLGAHVHAWLQDVIRMREFEAQGHRDGVLIDYQVVEQQLAGLQVSAAIFCQQRYLSLVLAGVL